MAIKHKTIKASGDVGLASEWNDNHVVDGAVDFLQHQILNHVIENRTDFPAGPVEGQIIYRTDLKSAFIWDGTIWKGTAVSGWIIVATDGAGDFTDIQTAIDAAHAAGGGFIYIKAGTYTTTGLTLYNDITLMGEDWRTQIILTDEYSIFCINLSRVNFINLRLSFKVNSHTEAPIDIDNASYITFDRIFFDNATTSGNAVECIIWGSYGNTASYIRVRNCKFEKTGGATTTDAFFSIGINKGWIESNDLTGIDFNLEQYVIYQNMHITDNKFDRISGTTDTITKCTIRGNEIFDAGTSINLGAGSNYNAVIGNIVNVAPVNTGTGNEVAHNPVY